MEQSFQVGGPLARGLLLLLPRQRLDGRTLHGAQDAHGLRQWWLERRQRHRQREIVARLVVDQRVAQRAGFEPESVANAQRLVLRLAEDERLVVLELDARVLA